MAQNTADADAIEIHPWFLRNQTFLLLQMS